MDMDNSVVIGGGGGWQGDSMIMEKNTIFKKSSKLPQLENQLF